MTAFRFGFKITEINCGIPATPTAMVLEIAAPYGPEVNQTIMHITTKARMKYSNPPHFICFNASNNIDILILPRVNKPGNI